MFWNLLSLYGVQIGTAVLPLITVPYVARVLGPANWGLGAFFTAFGLWISVIVEYGFNLSSSRRIARAQSDGTALDEIVASILGAKLLLVTVSSVVIAVALAFVPVLGRHPGLLSWTLLYAAALGFSPFWYFQGVERMVPAAILELTTRGAAAGATFLVVRGPDDLGRWLALQSIAAAVCTFASLLWMFREVPLHRPRLSASLAALRGGWNMTVFRASTTLSTTISTLILGLTAPAAVVGYFAGAEKIARAQVALFIPLSQAIYPRITALAAADGRQARSLASKGIAASAIGAVLVALLGAAVAPEVVSLALGPKFAKAVVPFRVLQFLVPLAVVRNTIGMSYLLPAGQERSAGLWVISGFGANVLLALCLTSSAGAAGMAWIALGSESLVLAGYLISLVRAGNEVPNAGCSLNVGGRHLECCD